MATMLCLFGSVATAQPVKQKVAVYVTGDADAGYKKVIGSKLVSGITRSENYAAVERTADFLAEMTKEQDYQMSGAVSDNQIAKLGQQFGVRYVLVADISEVFESMFISARMIDVQTGQITAATEGSGNVNSIDGLTKLAENVVLEIVGAPVYAEDAVKLLGPYTDFDKLYDCSAPAGYHIASKEEIESLIKNYQMTGKKLSFPIYADMKASRELCTVDFNVWWWEKNKLKEKQDYYYYYEYTVTATLITDVDKSSIWKKSYWNDKGCYPTYRSKKNEYEGKEVAMLDHCSYSTKPSITSGYVYVIKDKENK